jgi:vitamin B12 transporter
MIRTTRIFRAAAITAAAWLIPSAAASGQAPAPAPAAPDTASFVVVDGDTLWLAPPLEILGSRVPAALPGTQRHVAVLSADDLASTPARSLPERLQSVPSVVPAQRRQFDVQSDLTVRGSTFEQVQVLLDGYDMSDPQTGHHLLNLPVGEHDVARLELLPGHGSAQYGSGAFGGTLNVATKRPAAAGGGSLAVTGGGEGLWAARGSVDLSGGGDDAPRARLSVGRLHTDGVAYETPNGAGATEADVFTAVQRLLQTSDAGEVDVLVGAAQRDFGAPGFYAPYPSRERTRTVFAGVRVNRRLGDRVTIEPRLYGRRHEDRFVLIEDNPSAYTNDHATRKLGGELRGIVALGSSRAVAVGLEGVYEDIVSTGVRGGAVVDALGRHDRRRAALSLELDQGGGPWRWQVGGRYDLRSDWKPRLEGTAAVSRDLAEGLTLQAGAGTVYRVPTFTDLYYDSPTSRGDPGLQPEHGWAWDLGLTRSGEGWRARLTWFVRHEEDLIDWARPEGGTVWVVRNVAEGRVRGLEAETLWQHARGHRLVLAGAWIDKEIDLQDGYEGRYTLLVPEVALSAAGAWVFGGGVSANAAARHVRRSGGPDAFRETTVFDAGLDWRGRTGWFTGLLVSNVFDREVQEVPGVTLGGRLLSVTVGRDF